MHFQGYVPGVHWAMNNWKYHSCAPVLGTIIMEIDGTLILWLGWYCSCSSLVCKLCYSILHIRVVLKNLDTCEFRSWSHCSDEESGNLYASCVCMLYLLIFWRCQLPSTEVWSIHKILEMLHEIQTSPKCDLQRFQQLECLSASCWQCAIGMYCTHKSMHAEHANCWLMYFKCFVPMDIRCLNSVLCLRDPCFTVVMDRGLLRWSY